MRCKTVKRQALAHSAEHSAADPVIPASNLLIDSLPRKERTNLLSVCEPVALRTHSILCEAGRRSGAVYFPTAGAISLVATVAGEVDSEVDVALIGSEGMLGAHWALGIAEAPMRAVVRYPGSAWRVSSAALRIELTRGAALQRCCRRYLWLQMGQLATAVACERRHTIGPRLARLLLMLCDRTAGTAGAALHVTHAALAQTLGVRRVGITMAAGELSRLGLISGRRAELLVLDRPGLESLACSCYASDRRAQAQWMPAVRAVAGASAATR